MATSVAEPHGGCTVFAALALALASCAAVPDLDLAPRWTLLGHDSDVVSVAVSADGARVYSADITGKIRDWSLATGEPISVITPVDGADKVVFAAGGDRALAARSNIVLAIDMHKRELVTTFETGPRTAATLVADVAVSPHGGTVLVAERDGGVSIWNLRTSRPTRLAGDGLSGGPGQRLSALSANGRLALIGSRSAPDVEIWDLLSGRRIGLLVGEASGTRLVAFMPDGGRAAIVGTDDVIRIWALATGEQMAALHDDDALGISAIAFPAAGGLVITGHNDGAICGDAWVGGHAPVTALGYVDRAAPAGVLASRCRGTLVERRAKPPPCGLPCRAASAGPRSRRPRRSAGRR